MSSQQVAAILALLAVGCGGGGPEPSASERPDVVIYLVDTLRADHLSPWGVADERTPNLARLAREGVVFEQASAAAPWTLPSVVSLMTSTFVTEHDVHVDGRTLNPELPTLAETLGDAGYATVSFFRNPYAGPLSGLERDFDYSRRLGGAHKPRLLTPYLKATRKRPLFCYMHTIEPHDPYRFSVEQAAPFGEVSEEQRGAFEVAARRYRALTRVDFVAGDPLGTFDNSAEQAAEIRTLDAMRPAIDALYTSAVVEADRRLGDLITELQAARRWDDTLFVFVSDHGEEMGEHGGWLHDQSLYEELVHVPLVVRFPGGEFAGQRVSAPVSLVDVMPTVLDVAGLRERGARTRGRSLRALLAGDAPSGPRVTSMRRNKKKYYRPFHEARGDLNVAVRDGSWKAIWNVELGTVELYDLAADPGESRDLAGAEPERAERLRALAQAALDSSSRARVPARTAGGEPVDDETRSALEALGYVGSEDE